MICFDSSQPDVHVVYTPSFSFSMTISQILSLSIFFTFSSVRWSIFSSNFANKSCLLWPCKKCRSCVPLFLYKNRKKIFLLICYNLSDYLVFHVNLVILYNLAWYCVVSNVDWSAQMRLIYTIVSNKRMLWLRINC